MKSAIRQAKNRWSEGSYAAVSDWEHVSLEDLDVREFAKQDPRGFLNQHPAPLVIDEAQHVPSLFSYIQTRVDASGRMGQYVLSGSQQLNLLAGVTQSLAGRAAFVDIYPLRLKELLHVGRLPKSLNTYLLQGGYPAVYARRAKPDRYYADYVRSYLERDVRTLTAVHDLGLFQRFVRLCAARTGQLLNVNALANDCGISHPTASAWLNVLEASYIIKRIAPYHRNFGKRLVKTPKLYFLDTGLCAWLLGIRDETALQHHHARGALFETWAVTEALKWQAVRGDAMPLYYWRDNVGNEVDIVRERGHTVDLIEIKSGATFHAEALHGLHTVARHIGDVGRLALIYGGDQSFHRSDAQVLAWRDLAEAG